MSISIVAGLGNPGLEYEKTRHNIGFIVLDALASKHGLSWQKERSFKIAYTTWNPSPELSLLLVKPLAYMNESGGPLQSIASYYKIPGSSIAVVYDDINIDTGLVKVSLQGSAGGHNGIVSLIERLGSGFTRYRIGIGPKTPPQMDLKDYVLGQFTTEQQTIIESKMDFYLDGLQLLVKEGADRAMNILNRRTLQ